MALIAGHVLLLASGCQLVLPSVRTGGTVEESSCIESAELDGGSANSMSQNGEGYAVRPPHSKFHPVPTRPVFCPAAPAALTAPENIPLPAHDEPEPFQNPPVDSLPAEENPEAPESTDDGEPAEPEADLEVTRSQTKNPHVPAVLIRWLDDATAR